MPLPDPVIPRDRRAHPRHRCRLPVRGGESGAMPARTTDLSAGGARLERLDSGRLRLGQRLNLKLSLPDGPLKAAAEVVAVDEDGLFSTGAVRFASLDPENVRRLRALVSRRSTLRAGARPLARISLARAQRG